MTRRAGRSGAMSGSSTGPGPRRLGCLRKSASRKSGEHPSVDRREAEGDQREAGEILGCEGFTQEEAAEQDCDRRGKERPQEGICGAGTVGQPGGKDVDERGAEEGQSRDFGGGEYRWAGGWAQAGGW